MCEMHKTADFYSNLLISWELVTEGYQGRPVKCVHFERFMVWQFSGCFRFPYVSNKKVHRCRHCRQIHNTCVCASCEPEFEKVCLTNCLLYIDASNELNCSFTIHRARLWNVTSYDLVWLASIHSYLRRLNWYHDTAYLSAWNLTFGV